MASKLCFNSKGEILLSTHIRATSWTWGCRWLVLALVVLLSACRAELFSKLDESDANAVLEVLHAEGIAAYKVAVESGRFRVEVDDESLQRALHVAREQGVPRQRFATMGDLFKKEGLVSSPSEERLRYIFAVSQELSNTLSQIDGVIAARVHPVIPANDPLADKVRPSSAAVFIKHRADADLQQMALAIKTLVTRSIEGLTADNVSLTFFAVPLRQASAPADAVAAAARGNTVTTALMATLAVVLAALGVVFGFRWWRGRKVSAARPGGTLRLHRPVPAPPAEPLGADAAAMAATNFAAQAPLAHK